ncbi:hypothetical protein ACFL6L_03720 [candidate division KSB1 bacterium]
MIIRSHDSDNYGYMGSFDPTGFLFPLTIPLGIFIGHKVGSRIYVDWQEYDLPGDYPGRRAFMDQRRNRQITVGLRIPLRR